MSVSARHDPDPPACHLLGLVGDPASHFTYPHEGHRCYATGAAAHVDSRVQTVSCLSREHVACERFLAWRFASTGTPAPRATVPSSTGIEPNLRSTAGPRSR